LIVSTVGEAGGPGSLTGFYFREARFLSTLRLEIDGERPWLCEAAAVSPDQLQFVYTYPEVAVYEGGGSGQAGDEEPRNRTGLPQRGLDITLTYRVMLDRLSATALLGNRTRVPLTFEVSWILEADFADIQEAQAGRREQQAAVDVQPAENELRFTYRHRELPYVGAVSLTGGAWRVAPRSGAIDVVLAPGATIAIGFEMHARGAVGGPIAAAGERAALLARWRDSFTRIRSPRNSSADRMIGDNVRDFASFPLLEGDPDEWLTLQAGFPLYPALFGRDAITAGWQAGCVDRGQSLDAALTTLGRLQSDSVEDWRDEEPGRIPYQVRRGPLAVLNLNPYSAYYADFASPLAYVISLANLYAWTGDERAMLKHWDTARRILDWARDYGDADRDGYLEYRTRSSKGTKNQGWKDSGDAIVYDDGRPVPPPIATCEIQGYWYAAQQLMGVLCWMTGASADARDWFAAAAGLKARFNRDWWMDGEEFVALAMDPDKALVRAATSNVGHCLATGIIDSSHVPPVVGRLFAPDMFSGWGIRTLSSDHQYYNPLSYHRGTVWAVEQATTVFGLRRFGFDARANDLARALFDLAALYPEHRIPECVGGYPRATHPAPGAYPQANAPQLWNATAFPLVMQTLAGIVPLAPYETVVVDPALPDWLPELVFEQLRVGAATVTLRFWRDADGQSTFDVVRKRGTLHVVRQPPPESLSADLWQRIHGVMESVA
jgi:glycogen debranching enzyme